MEGLIGKKLGMTQVFDEKGDRVPVTVLAAGPCVVVQRKTLKKDGYDAVQVGFDEVKERSVNKPALGRFKKAEVTPRRILREFRVDEASERKAGDTIDVSAIFDGISHVDVVGTTKGRGFAGVVKRWGMKGGRMTHGGHSKRRVGAIGQCAYPARVAKGKRMPGHMGNVKVMQQNLKVVQIRPEENLLLVRGAVPGAKGSVVIIRKALKIRKPAAATA
jgi:large subunit ribosomal protein L3